MLDNNIWADSAITDWRIGTISYVDQHTIKVKASATDMLDQVINGEIREIKSLNQYLFSYLSITSKVIFKVVSIEENESYYGKGEEQKSLNQYILRAVPLGQINEGEYHPGVIEIPMVGTNVYTCSGSDLRNLFNDGTEENGASLGNLASYQGIEPYINIDKFYTNHTVIIGNTGSGKSTTARLLLDKYNEYFREGRIKENAKVIVFDVHGDYLDFLSQDKEEHQDKEECCHVVLSSSDYHLSAGLLTLEDWTSILSPSQKIQKPLLERAVKYSKLNDDGKKKLYAAFAYTAISNSSYDTHASRKTQIQKYYQRIQDELDVSAMSEQQQDDTKDGINEYLRNAKLYEKILKKSNEITPKILMDYLVLGFGNIPSGVVEALQTVLRAYINKEIVREPNNETSDKDSKCNRPHEYMRNNIPNYDRLLDDPCLKKEESKITLKDIRDALDFVFDEEEVKGNRQARSYSEGLVTQLNNLCDKYSNTLFKPNQGKEITECIKNQKGIVILDVSDVKDSDGLKLFSNFVARTTLDENVSRGKEDIQNYPVILFFDEAHRYIREADLPDDSIFNRIAREGRKFGVWLTAISQIPSELSKVVLSQAGTFVIHRIQNSIDLEYVRRNVPAISSDQVDRLSSFPPGMAVILGSSMRLPIELQVDGKYQYITSGTSIFK